MLIHGLVKIELQSKGTHGPSLQNDNTFSRCVLLFYLVSILFKAKEKCSGLLIETAEETKIQTSDPADFLTCKEKKELK